MNLYFGLVKDKSKIVSRKKYLELENNIITKWINKEGFFHDKNGKPNLINNDLNISISNNNKIVLIITHEKLIGVDLQLIKEKTKLPLNKIRLVSMKEALFKAYNINYNLIDKLDIKEEKYNVIRINKKKLVLFSKVLGKYVISICHEI